MHALEQLRGPFIIVALLASVLYWVSYTGSALNVGSEAPAALAAICLALGALGGRAALRKSAGHDWPIAFAWFGAFAWIVALVGGLWAAESGPAGIVPGLLMMLPGAVAGTLLSAIVLVGFVLEARRPRA